jgi:hypothetical protein
VGRGTPGLWDAPRRVVAAGPYRWVRNPIYIAALLVVLGEAWLFMSLPVLTYVGAGSRAGSPARRATHKTWRRWACSCAAVLRGQPLPVATARPARVGRRPADHPTRYGRLTARARVRPSRDAGSVA